MADVVLGYLPSAQRRLHRELELILYLFIHKANVVGILASGDSIEPQAFLSAADASAVIVFPGASFGLIQLTVEAV